MNLHSVSMLLISCCLLVIGADADEMKLTKAQELAQAKELVSKLSASNSLSKRPIIGGLNYWHFRINTYSDDYEQQLKREALYPLYYDCCSNMNRLYGSKVITYLSKDKMGYASQKTIVNFDDSESGKSHLIVGLWEGNDSTGFYFLHLTGEHYVDKVWEKRDSWNLEGNFFDAKKPAEQVGADQPATPPKSNPSNDSTLNPESKPRPQ